MPHTLGTCNMSFKKHIWQEQFVYRNLTQDYLSYYYEISDDIENEIFKISKENDCICLFGELNSRVSTLNDCIEVDDSLSQLCNITENDNNLNWAFDEIDLKAIEKYVFFIERKSKDNIVNYYEKKNY